MRHMTQCSPQSRLGPEPRTPSGQAAQMPCVNRPDTRQSLTWPPFRQEILATWQPSIQAWTAFRSIKKPPPGETWRRRLAIFPRASNSEGIALITLALRQFHYKRCGIASLCVSVSDGIIASFQGRSSWPAWNAAWRNWGRPSGSRKAGPNARGIRLVSCCKQS